MLAHAPCAPCGAGVSPAIRGGWLSQIAGETPAPRSTVLRNVNRDGSIDTGNRGLAVYTVEHRSSATSDDCGAAWVIANVHVTSEPSPEWDDVEPTDKDG
jgi:hypothetical protein